MLFTDYKLKEKNMEEDLPSLGVVFMQQFWNLKNVQNRNYKTEKRKIGSKTTTETLHETN